MSYSADVFVADEQPTTAKWNKLWTNDASFNDGTGIADGSILPEHLVAATGTDWAWDSWSPSYSGLTIGNGTVVSNYIQIGNTAFWMYRLTAGTTTSATGSVLISPPVTPSSTFSTSLISLLGSGIFFDTSASTYYTLFCPYRSGGIEGINPCVQVASSTNTTLNGMSGSVPVAMATGDILEMSGNYEIA